MILLQRLGQIFIHLGLDAAFPVAHHCVSSKGDDGSSLRPKATLIFSNLARGFKTALRKGQSTFCAHRWITRLCQKAYHNGHLYVHENDIEPPVLYHLHSL